MKVTFSAVALALLLASPAGAQSAADAVTQAAKQAAADAATQAVNDTVNRAAGTEDAGKGKGNKGRMDKDGPNWGKSEGHRQDGEHGHKGKGKNKDR